MDSKRQKWTFAKQEYFSESTFTVKTYTVFRDKVYFGVINIFTSGSEKGHELLNSYNPDLREMGSFLKAWDKFKRSKDFSKDF